MKTVKSLLLGTAAGFIAIAGAQAADLPGKAAPAEYVRICDTYGAGFFFIPGTDTCLRIGGYLRHESYLAETINPGGSAYTTRTRFFMSMDARSNTEYGLLRGFASVSFQRGPGNNTLPFNLAVGAGSTGQASAAYLGAAFIQFAGFTAGNAASFFNFYQGDVQFVTAAGAGFDPSRGNSNLLAYTASFGSGFSATVSIEDPQFRRVGAIATVAGVTFTAPAAANGIIYNGQGIPDIVANLRVDQGWGAAQLMGALHEMRTTNGLGNNVSRMGYAVGLGIRLNLDMLARGDQLWLQGAYSNGALSYTAWNDNSDGLVQTRQAIGVKTSTATYADGIFNPILNRIEATSVWSIHAGFRHFWTPALRSALWGKYVNVNAPAPLGVANNLNDFNFYQIGFNTVWSPVRNLDLGVEVVYSNISRRTAAGAAIAGSNQGAFSGVLRVQRNF